MLIMENQEGQVVYLRIDDIIPNRFQPREVFDETGLEELSESIKEHGVIQPIIVREIGDKYELIAGERRTKASALAGLTTIPAIIRNMDDKESAKVSLLENLQRKNLSAIEEARTYKRILELDNMTQEELARNLGRSQPMVANKLRLLSLPEEIQDALMMNQISERHARSLLTVKDKKDQLMFLDKIKRERLTVRELDAELKKYKKDPQSYVQKQFHLNNQDEMLSLNIENNGNENKEESYMNNNIGNFGGMGLNDYHSGVNNNMFYNTPNNFNNMPNIENSTSDTETNYNTFNETEPDKNTKNDNFNSMNNITNSFENNSFNQNKPSSLGSMFDGNNGEISNYTPSNDNNSNLFVSHIREDNLPKTENRFLPNFDTFENNNFNEQSDFNSNMGMDINNNFNAFQDNFGMNNNQQDFNTNNFNDNYSSNFQPMNNQMSNQKNFESNNYGYQDMSDNNMMNNYGMNNNFVPNNDMNNGPIYNDNFNTMHNNNNIMNEMTSGNYFMNDLNHNNFDDNDSDGTREALNTFNQNNNFNDQNEFNSNITNSFGMGNNYDMNNNTFNNNYDINNMNGMNNHHNLNSQTMNNQMNPMNNYQDNTISNYNGNFGSDANMNQPNQGGLFNQPLNIVGVPQNNYNQMNNIETPIENNELHNMEEEPKNETHIDDNYMFSNPNLPKEEMEETTEPIEIPQESSEQPEFTQPEPIEQPIPDIEVIGEGEIPVSPVEQPNEVPATQEETVNNSNDYIRLDPTYTINSTMDAVLELKKTTDKIKQNNIDIETEEIHFDDVYQITIKIKKTDTI